MRSFTKKSFWIFIPLLLFSTERARFRTIIAGKVVDSETGTPLEYATVIAYRVSDSTKAGGIATDSLGRFILKGLPFGEYFIEVDFIGYKKKVIRSVKLTKNKRFVRLGKIYLNPAYIEAKPVEVRAKAPVVTFRIDRKVVNVSEELSSESATAVDVLKNVPSIEVDIEGNVKLRGSSNFTLLIDGRPTLADPSEVLQQFPAAIIDKIEIITNPSAKYDPEGESGIINIVLKKGRKRVSGYTVSISMGTSDNYGGSVLYTRRSGKLDFYLSLNGAKRNYPGEIFVYKRHVGDSDTVEINSYGSSRFSRDPAGFRAGINFKISESGVLSSGVNFFKWGMERFNENNYTNHKTDESFDIDHPLWSVFVGYKQSFSSRTNFSIDISSGRGKRQIETYYLEKNMEGSPLFGRKVSGSGSSRRLDLVINLKKMSDNWNIEVGTQSKFRYRDELSRYYLFDTTTGDFVEDNELNYTQKRQIHSVYALLSGKISGYGYQLGLRGEIERRNIEDPGAGKSFVSSSYNLFPSIHISTGEIRQFMISYTRRIRRPRGWMIAPFRVWVDPHTIRKGNPDLKSVLIDSYEATFRYPLSGGFFSVSGYHKTIHDDIERITIPLSENVFIETFDNAGTGYRTGAEAFLNVDLRWISLNWSFDIYRFFVKGNLNGKGYENKSVSWSTRVTGNIKAGKDLKFQITYRYRSPVATLQGERAGFHTMDVGLRKLFGRNLSVTLRIQNIDGGFKWEYYSEGPGYYSRKRFTRDSRVISLSIRYNHNMFKKQRERYEEPENFEEAF